jgi:hypothetical protein
MEYFGPRGVSRCPLGRKKKKFEYEGEYESTSTRTISEREVDLSICPVLAQGRL